MIISHKTQTRAWQREGTLQRSKEPSTGGLGSTSEEDYRALHRRTKEPSTGGLGSTPQEDEGALHRRTIRFTFKCSTLYSSKNMRRKATLRFPKLKSHHGGVPDLPNGCYCVSGGGDRRGETTVKITLKFS